MFIEQQPEYPLNDLSKLQIDIPNGEHKTDFRYAIGGLLMQKIYKREGMPGLFEALRSGNAETDYFNFLEKKLGVTKDNFEAYIKQEIKNRWPDNMCKYGKLNPEYPPPDKKHPS